MTSNPQRQANFQSPIHIPNLTLSPRPIQSFFLKIFLDAPINLIYCPPTVRSHTSYENNLPAGITTCPVAQPQLISQVFCDEGGAHFLPQPSVPISGSFHSLAYGAAHQPLRINEGDDSHLPLPPVAASRCRPGCRPSSNGLRPITQRSNPARMSKPKPAHATLITNDHKKLIHYRPGQARRRAMSGAPE